MHKVTLKMMYAGAGLIFLSFASFILIKQQVSHSTEEIVVAAVVHECSGAVHKADIHVQLPKDAVQNISKDGEVTMQLENGVKMKVAFTPLQNTELCG